MLAEDITQIPCQKIKKGTWGSFNHFIGLPCQWATAPSGGKTTVVATYGLETQAYAVYVYIYIIINIT